MFDKDATGRFPPFVVKEIDPELVDHSRPKYNFTNAMDVDPVEGTLVVFLSPNDASGWVRSEERWRGTFFQVMQLAAFPFDAQTLQLSLRLPRRIDYGRSFVQFHNSVGPQVEMKDWVRLAEWRRYEPTAETSTDSKGRLQCAELIWLAAWLARYTQSRSRWSAGTSITSGPSWGSSHPSPFSPSSPLRSTLTTCQAVQASSSRCC